MTPEFTILDRIPESPETTLERLRRLLAPGEAVRAADLARRLGVSRQAVSDLIHRHKLPWVRPRSRCLKCHKRLNSWGVGLRPRTARRHNLCERCMPAPRPLEPSGTCANCGAATRPRPTGFTRPQRNPERFCSPECWRIWRKGRGGHQRKPEGRQTQG